MEQEKRSKVNPTQSMRDAMKKATTEMLVLFMLRQKPMYPSITMVLLPVLLQQAEREQVLTGGAMEIKRHGLAETVPI